MTPSETWWATAWATNEKGSIHKVHKGIGKNIPETLMDLPISKIPSPVCSPLQRCRGIFIKRADARIPMLWLYVCESLEPRVEFTNSSGEKISLQLRYILENQSIYWGKSVCLALDICLALWAYFWTSSKAFNEAFQGRKGGKKQKRAEIPGSWIFLLKWPGHSSHRQQLQNQGHFKENSSLHLERDEIHAVLFPQRKLVSFAHGA